MNFTSAQQAVDLLTRAVQERGESFTYTPIPTPRETDRGSMQIDQCMYIHPDGAPGCIVGLALTRAGVSPDVFAEVENWPAGRALTQLGITPSRSDFAKVMDVAQEQQDTGRTWGDALAHATSMAARIEADRAESATVVPTRPETALAQ